MEINKVMHAALKALSYPDLDVKKTYKIKRRLEGGWNGTDFSLISADYLGFVPKKICE